MAQADPPSMMEAIVGFDSATHDLLVALDEPCECDEGTCTRDVDVPL